MFEGLIYFVRSLIKKPIKIGLISYYFLQNKSQDNGVAIHTRYLSQKLAEFGCEVHVFTRGEKNYTEKSYPKKGKLIIHYIDTRFDAPLYDVVARKRMAYFIFDNKIINEITKENAKKKFDVIHTHGWLTAGAFISKYLNNLRWVHTFHALEKNRLRFMSEDEKKYYKIARWIESTIKHADALIAVSGYVKREVIKDYLIKPEKVFKIYNGVDLKMFKPENTADEKIILYVGRFSFEKGMDIVPSIAKIVLEKNKNAKFIIVAPGVVLPSMERTEKEYKFLERKYRKRITLIRDSIPREELVKIYNKCSVYIQPSKYDSCPTTLLEAMACGKAVIGSDRGGIPEIIENVGMIVPLNSQIFALQILKLLEGFRLRERYGRKALKKAELFDWNRIAGKTLALYKKLIGENKGKNILSKLKRDKKTL